MVDLLGHFGMALIFALPAWVLWDGRVSLAFIALVLMTAMLPDVDLALLGLPLGIQHHGVTHTILFVVVISLIAGAVVEFVFGPWIQRQWAKSQGHELTGRVLFVFVSAGFLVGGFRHLFADVLSAPDISTPIEPFWPVVSGSLSIALIWYTSPWWNEGLLLVSVALHLLLAYVDIRLDHPYRFSQGH